MKFLFTPKTSAAIFATFSFFLATDLMANSCSKADVDFYLQRGFTNDQVVRLCTSSGAAAPNTQYQQQYAAPADPKTQALREDQIFLSTALDVKSVQLTPAEMTYSGEECVVYSPHPNNRDMDESLCVNSRVVVKFAGASITKVSKGFFLVKDPELVINGNIKREYLNLNEIRRQERAPIQRLLPSTANTASIKVRSGIDPKKIADVLSKYIK